MFVFLNNFGCSDKIMVRIRVEVRALVGSCSYLWEKTVVWIKEVVVKVSGVKIYFGDRSDRFSDRLDVGDYRRGKLGMIFRFLVYVIGGWRCYFLKLGKLGEGIVVGCVCYCLFLSWFI